MRDGGLGVERISQGAHESVSKRIAQPIARRDGDPSICFACVDGALELWRSFLGGVHERSHGYALPAPSRQIQSFRGW
jgi:hypothetical protein